MEEKEKMEPSGEGKRDGGGGGDSKGLQEAPWE